jgi:uroporphyrinogen-III synthase
LVDLAAAGGLVAACRGVIAGCLSPAVAAAVNEAGFARVVTAARPNEDALVEVLTSALRGALQGGAQNATS